MATLPRCSTFALIAVAALPLAAWPGAPLAPSPAAAVALAAPAALREAAPAMLLRVKALRKCKKICIAWKKCPPPWQWQPPGCSASYYPDQPHEGFFCVKSKRRCWLPTEGTTHPPNRFHISPPLLSPERGLSPGAPAPFGSPPPARSPSRIR